MTTNTLYHSLMHQIKQLWEQERVTTRRGLAWLMTCLYLGRSSSIERIANKIQGQAKKKSKGERLRRWLDKSAVNVRQWYEPVARQLLTAAMGDDGRPLQLIVDGTCIGSNHQLLIVSLAFRRRTLPLAWTWVPYQRGHSTSTKQIALLNYVHTLLPVGAVVTLVGDSEFGAVELLRWLDEAGWYYVLRQTGKHQVRLADTDCWQRFDELAKEKGVRLWHPQAQLTLKHEYTTNLLVYWQPREREPWLLVTNHDNSRDAIRHYRRRMWIESMFGDIKRNGFDLEAVRLQHASRLSRLMLAVALLYVWIIAFGSAVVKRGQRALVDRKDRRTLSLFRIGFDRLERCLVNGEAFSLRLLPYF